MIMKMRIGNTLYDVITYEDYLKNKLMYYQNYIGSVAIIKGDGLVYPLRHQNDSRCGIYPGPGYDIFKPPFPDEMAQYSSVNIINFSKAESYSEVIKCQEALNQSEQAILTTIDHLTVPEISKNDTPAMKALKSAIIAKHIDLDKYDYRFGIENFPNDKRLLRRDSITLSKLKTYGDALDMEVILTLKDKNENVANPMGKTITVSINGDGSNDEGLEEK